MSEQTKYNRALIHTSMSEKDFQQQVVTMAHALGWKTYHTLYSIKSALGYPDLTMVSTRQHRIIFAELKTEKGKISPNQAAWLEALRTPKLVEVYTWRPSDIATIQQCMEGVPA